MYKYEIVAVAINSNNNISCNCVEPYFTWHHDMYLALFSSFIYHFLSGLLRCWQRLCWVSQFHRSNLSNIKTEQRRKLQCSESIYRLFGSFIKRKNVYLTITWLEFYSRTSTTLQRLLFVSLLNCLYFFVTGIAVSFLLLRTNFDVHHSGTIPYFDLFVLLKGETDRITIRLFSWQCEQ